MSEERPKGQELETDDEQARLKRPDKEVKDLDAPPDEADKARGGRGKTFPKVEYDPG